MCRTWTLPPDPSRLIEGLRDTGYDFNTALADIVDNSVDAGAENISISILMGTNGDLGISVVDDGCGMDEQALENGMRYGSEDNKSGSRLGIFGLGLKTASTAFCRRLSVITRSSEGAPTLKAVWDLDHVAKVRDWTVLVEEPTSEQLRLLDSVAGDGSGTLVTWTKIDRLMKRYANPRGAHAQKALEKIVAEFRDHAAMVYQRHLDNNDDRGRYISMVLNGTAIEPWDPFCKTEKATKLVAEEIVDVDLPDFSASTFTLKAYVLPGHTEFSDESARKAARLTNANQGLYVYRENRLIHKADWLGMYSKEQHGALLRVEFSFDHTLDQAFHVDIKKSRVLLSEDLYDFIKDFLVWPRSVANDRYRQVRKTEIGENSQDAHADSNKVLNANAKSLEMGKTTETGSDQAVVENVNGMLTMNIRPTSKPKVDGEVRIQTVDSLDDGLLWEPTFVGKHHAVNLNTGHPYYEKVYVPNYKSGVTVRGLDSLLWALAEAELGTANESTKKYFSEFRYGVSRLLRKLVEDFPEPSYNEDEAGGSAAAE